MSKLLERLSDPKKSGVYRVAHDRDVRDALTGAACDLVMVALVPNRMLSSFNALLSIRWKGTFSFRRLSPALASVAPNKFNSVRLSCVDFGATGSLAGASAAAC